MFGVSRQVYYRKKRGKKKKQSLAEKVISLVKEIRLKMPRIGTRKLYFLLEKDLKTLKIGRDKLFSILRANHLLITPKRNYRVTTHTHHRFRKHKDLLKKRKIRRAEQFFVADITYVDNKQNDLYLALITDVYSKKVMGFDLSESLSSKGAERALEMAVSHRIYHKHKLIHYSDKGIQYCCNEYQKLLSKNNIRCSMTESYDPYSNAVAERINGILKIEFELEKRNLPLEIMRKLVAESIEIYNNERPHYSCQYLTPNQMHKQNKIRIKTYKRKNQSKMNSTLV